MISKNVTLQNSSGLHARPAALFIKAASTFKSNILVKKGDKQVSAKSLLSLLSLGISKGTEITITADGEDENNAVNALVDLINSNFGE